MPINAKYSLKENIEAIEYYLKLPEDVVRRLLMYAVTSSWLVYAALLEQYAGDPDEPTDLSDAPF